MQIKGKSASFRTFSSSVPFSAPSAFLVDVNGGSGPIFSKWITTPPAKNGKRYHEIRGEKGREKRELGGKEGRNKGGKKSGLGRQEEKEEGRKIKGS